MFRELEKDTAKLGYYQSPDKKEVDFVSIKQGNPVEAIEVKTNQERSTTEYNWFRKSFSDIPLRFVERKNAHRG